MNEPTDGDRAKQVSLLAFDRDAFGPSCLLRKRQRVTIDLRGIGPRLDGHAATRGKTIAAVVRTAVVAMLDAQGTVEAPDRVAGQSDTRAVKVTVRMGAFHAVRLLQCARRVGVSQGTYLEGLLDGQPPAPKSADHGAAVSALANSTQRVAAMSTDIHALLRLASNCASEEAQRSRESLTSLSTDVRTHLEIASRLMAGLTSRQRRGVSAVSTRRRHGAPR